jgi:hypothetical protein
MAISSEMKLRLDKIDFLIKKGYSIKNKNKNFIPILISPEGKFVNTFFRSRFGDDSLPGFSWIAFFFSFIFATKIRNWKYFWVVGLIVFILSIIESIFNIDTSYASSIGISMVYGFGYPLQRWLFVKSNKEEIGTFISVLLGLLLSLVAAIPAFIVDGIFSP